MPTATVNKERISERIKEILDEIETVVSAEKMGPTEATEKVLNTRGVTDTDTLCELFGSFDDLYQTVVVGLTQRVYRADHQYDKESRERVREEKRSKKRAAAQPSRSTSAWRDEEAYHNLTTQHETADGACKTLLEFTAADAEWSAKKSTSYARSYQGKARFFEIVRESLKGKSPDTVVGSLPTTKKKMLDRRASELLK